MIIYHSTLGDFQKACHEKSPKPIEELVADQMTIHGLAHFIEDGIKQSWKKSLPVVAETLQDNFSNDGLAFDKNIGVAVEYEIDASQGRIDFILYGNDGSDKPSLVIVELKQWSFVSGSKLPDFVFTNTGAGPEDALHPSYQAFHYLVTLKNTNYYLETNNVNLYSCSFLHNLPREYDSLIRDVKKFYLLRDPVESSPEFSKDDCQDFRLYLYDHVKKPNPELINLIDEADVVPSKRLVKDLNAALKGEPFFGYDDDQAYSVSMIVSTVQEAVKSGKRKTIIIKGGPGTGKSIVAINALGQLIKFEKEGKNYSVCYATQNAAPRNQFLSILNANHDANFSMFFKSPRSFDHSKALTYNCILVDEAHRVFDWKPGVGVKQGINLLHKTMDASLVNVFFIDSDQAVTIHDYATVARIKDYAAHLESEVIESNRLSLKTQFRCSGGGHYIDFVRSVLGYPEAGLPAFVKGKYDFRVYDSAAEMRDELRELNKKYPPCRMVAGYTYKWISKKPETKEEPDIVLDGGGFKAQWNLRLGKKEDYSWVEDPNSFEQVGCIHTCQGIDLEYCGVIIGKDMTYEHGKVCFHHEAIASTDTASGARTAPDEIGNALVRNTYNVLLTRGMRGTFVYCEDKALGNYLKSFLPQEGD
jgi:DUF2075 family protein